MAQSFAAAKPTLSMPPGRLAHTIVAVGRSWPKTVIVAVLAMLSIIGFFLRIAPEQSQLGPAPAPYGSPSVVIVTAMTAETAAFEHRTIRNREEYTKRHGYGFFLAREGDYDVGQSPSSWIKVPAMRHAMTLYPHSTYFFYLAPQAMIANMDITVEKHIMNTARLKELMIRDKPIVPPDSVIRTFTHLAAEKVDMVITQDKTGLGKDSFVIRRGDWAKFFLDVWLDPVYRTYNFQKAEQHALEHIVQWHGSILAKLALLPQSILNSYSDQEAAQAGENGAYKHGDFIVNFGSCHRVPRNCEQEMARILR